MCILRCSGFQVFDYFGEIRAFEGFSLCVDELNKDHGRDVVRFAGCGLEDAPENGVSKIHDKVE
nr:hypothetical protein [Kiloniella majae]